MIKELYKTTEGKLHLPPDELVKLRNEDYTVYPDEAGHVCSSCGEENIEEDMLEYDGSWWCKDCCPELEKCERCGTVYNTEETEGVCPECKA